MFIVFKMLYYNERKKTIQIEQVSIVFGENNVISFQEKSGDVFGSVRKRIRNNIGNLRKSGTDFLIYSLIDAVVDHYFTTIEKIGEEIEKLEDKIIGRPNAANLKSLHKLKRDLIFYVKQFGL